MSAAIFTISDVDGEVSCVCGFADDYGNDIPFSASSNAHRAATMLIAYMDEACGRVGEATITTEAPKTADPAPSIILTS